MAALEDLKVLIVDDSITVREMMKHQVKSKGIETIETAKNGEEAFEKYKSFSPDLVFMDINMPVVNGVEGLRKIMGFDSDAYVVMLSSLGTMEKIKETLELGAKNFLMKPAEDKHLNRIMDELVS